MMRSISFALALLTSAGSAAAERPAPLPDLYLGKVAVQRTWQDGSGHNAVVIKQTGQPEPREDAGRFADAWLHAYQLRWRNGEWREVWHIKDFAEGCDLDYEVDYLPDTLRLTDLDGDGIKEVSFVYLLAQCRGDVSPMDMKLMLQDGPKKYAVRGMTELPELDEATGKLHFSGGNMKPDKAFDQAPPAFKAHALKLWREQVMKQRAAWQAAR